VVRLDVARLVDRPELEGVGADGARPHRRADRVCSGVQLIVPPD
jgi:hypothetical protein